MNCDEILIQRDKAKDALIKKLECQRERDKIAILELKKIIEEKDECIFELECDGSAAVGG